MILLSVGIAWAVSLEYDAVAFGAHSGRYTLYPDCQPEFAEAMNAVAQRCDWRKIEVLTPFIRWDKVDVVRRGLALGVPFEMTWGCYKGGEKHCGVCGTCHDSEGGFRPMRHRRPGRVRVLSQVTVFMKTFLKPNVGRSVRSVAST